MADTLESTGNYIPKDLRITSQPDAVDKNKFQVVATGLKIDESYVFQFQYVFEDGELSEWSPGYTINTPTETVPGAPSASVPSTSVGNIPVTLSTFPANAKRVDIYVIGGIYGTGKVVDSFFAAGTKTISISDAGVYQVSLITVTPSGINGDPTNTFTITVTGQQQVVEAPTLPSGLTVAAAPFAVSVNWGGQYSGSGFEGFKSIDIHVRGSDVGASATSGFSTTTQVATLTVDATTNRQNIGLDNLRQALGLANNTAAYTAPMFFYYIARNENDELYKVGGVATYTRINSSTVNPTQANFVDLANGVISIENLVAGNGQFSSWLRTGSAGGTRIELSGTNDFVNNGYTVQKGLVAYSSGNTEIFNLDIDAGKLTIKGDGEFTGNLSIGSGNNIFKAEPTTGIWLGNSAFASAPFSVSKTGVLTAQSGTIGGWAINSTQIRSNGVNQISLNPATPKIAIIQGSTLNAVTGLYEGGTEKITIDPVEGIVGPNITYNSTQVPAFKLTPSGNLTLYGSVTITGGQAKTDIENAQSTANSKNKTYYTSTAPTGVQDGDIWFDASVGYFKRYDSATTTWVRLKDSDITAAQSSATQAASDALSALTAANGKNKTYRATSNGQSGSAFGPSSPTSGFNAGDIWFNLSDGKRQYVYDGSAWVDMQDAQIAAAAAASQNKLNKSAYIIEDVSNNITSINANGIQLFATGSSGSTATSVPSSGNRLIINYEGIQAYDSSGPSFQLFANGGTAQFRGAVSGGTFTLTGATSTNYWTAGGFNMGAGVYSSGATAAMINYDGSSTITLVSGTVTQGDDTQSSPDGGGTVNAVSATSRIVLSSSGLTLKGIPKLGDYTRYNYPYNYYLTTESNTNNTSYGMGSAARQRALVRDPYDNQVYAGFAVYYGSRSSAPTGGTGNVGDLWVSW